MGRLIEERRLGSLLGALEPIATYIVAALVTRDVTIWVNSKAELVCSGAGNVPELPAESVLGTYGLGANVGDIHADLLAFRNERASHVMNL
ncbi:hypothetical protein [Dokdonella soli]|uniref:Uncharacterized protein n=1 Tax=Dokdonella soli TaxID=529810 RepID=A0ABP3TJY5_9GAMM